MFFQYNFVLTIHYLDCIIFYRMGGTIMTIGERLKIARKSKGMSQDILAEKIGSSRSVITNIEYNKVEEPQALAVNAICEILCINKEWLLHGTGEMNIAQPINKSNQILSEIYASSKNLSEEELDYILDLIKTFQKHSSKIKSS